MIMTSFMGLRGRPATSENSNDRRHSSILLDQSKNEKSNPDHTHRSRGSLQKLSLSLSNHEGNTFGSFFPSEPQEIPEYRKSEEKSRTSPELISHATLQSLPQEQLTEEGIAPLPQKVAEEDRQERSVRPERFSLLRFRYASEPQLSVRFKNAGDNPPTPKIITTAPTSQQLDESTNKKQKRSVFGRSKSPLRKSDMIERSFPEQLKAGDIKRPETDGAYSSPDLGSQKTQMDSILGPDRQVVQGPPAYGDESNSALAIPVTRLSESGGSEGSSGDHGVYARTTTTTISTTTTFFRLKRKKKDKGPLFPLPERFPRPSSEKTSIAGEGVRRSMSPGRRSTQVRFENGANGDGFPVPVPSLSLSALTNAPLGSPGPAIVRKHSTLSNHSGASTPSLLPPRLGARGRSSTMGSLSKASDRDGDATPQATVSSRTSTSTGGRRSFGDLLMFSHRMRQNSAPPRHGAGNSPSTPGSKSNSLQINRETEPVITYPVREESDTPASYLEKLEAAVQRGSLATILCKQGDDFSKTCLRKYMRGFSYFGESIDMSIRKMLMEVELPKETQQIDRLLAGFADRYHECNPGIFMTVDEASIVAFSILLLHSDNHNKNNKRKMQKADYVKNTQHGRVSVSGDILECFYDNICYTPFIRFDDEVAVNSHRLAAPRPKKSLIRAKSSDNVLRGQIDPYTLILDNKLELLRPPLKDVIETEDTYSSHGTLKSPNSNDHHRAFLHSAALQIVSARSRPDAFATQATISNPFEAQAGLVSIKVAKVGLLWRKDSRKKKAKRPWQEWGAILTDSKLYFFRDVSWTKKLIAQYDNHLKLTGRPGPLIFKPPMTSFEPDALMAVDDAVALLDSSYKKHKHAFTFIKHGGLEEVFLANNEGEMNDWVGKLNYAATFRTAGVRLRGLLGTVYEGKHLLRKNSELSTISGETGTSEYPNPIPKGIDPQLAWEIMFYRRQLINEKISSLDDKLAIAQKELDQLLRNARHLLILLPIQAKTREGLMYAAGRMTAKLRWTRIEVWRNKTHRDILISDLEAESNSAFPPPDPRTPDVTPKANAKRISQQTVQRNNADGSEVSPTPIIATPARKPSLAILEHIKTADIAPEDQLGQLPVHLKMSPASPKTSSFVAKDDLSSKRESCLDSSPVLKHTASMLSSERSRQEDEIINAVQGDDGADEERVLKAAGLTTFDSDVHQDSDKDKASALSTSQPETPSPKEHRTSVRRSLQRTLRESHHSHRIPSHHHRKARDSGSSAIGVEDGKEPAEDDNQELKRGAGSFILHGKKASVITMSSEWQTMASGERLRSRPSPTEEEQSVDEDIPTTPTPADMVRTPHLMAAAEVSPLVSPDREAFHSAPSSRKQSVASSLTESDTVSAAEELGQPA